MAKWENGSRDLKTEHTIVLADYFNVTCDYILRGVKAENVDVNKKLGLSDKAIQSLIELKKLSAAKGENEEENYFPLIHEQRINAINLLLSRELNDNFFELIAAYFWHDYENKWVLCIDDLKDIDTNKTVYQENPNREEYIRVSDKNTKQTYRYPIKILSDSLPYRIQEILSNLKDLILKERELNK